MINSNFQGPADLSLIMQFLLLDAKGTVMSHTKCITFDAKEFRRGRSMGAAVQVVEGICHFADRPISSLGLRNYGGNLDTKETHVELLKGASAPVAVTSGNRASRLELKHA